MNSSIFNILFFAIIGLLLLSCSRENPINKNALSVSGKLLYQASFYAEVQLNAGENHGGKDYESCVEGHALFSKQYCEAMYEHMINYAKKHNNAYKDLMIEDLVDANAYYQVKGYYDNQIFLNND